MYVCKSELCCCYLSGLGACRTVQRLHYSVPVTLGGIDLRDAFITVMLWDGGRGKGSCLQLWHAHY